MQGAILIRWVLLTVIAIAVSMSSVVFPVLADEVREGGDTVTASSFYQELDEKTGMQDRQITSVEKIADFLTNPVVVPILLSIATLAIIFELFSPGFGVPGSIGLCSFGLFFFGHVVAGYAEYESILLFIIGLVLLMAEFFVPGGVIGLLGAACAVLGLLMAGANITHMAYSILIAAIVALTGMVVLMKFFGKKLHVFNKLVLTEATTTEEGYVSNINRKELLGCVGKTITPLRPAGTLLMDGERMDVVSEGGYIEAGKLVEVIKVEGARIVVREKMEGEKN